MRLEGPIQGFSPLYLQLCYCLSTAGAPHVRVSIAEDTLPLWRQMDAWAGCLQSVRCDMVQDLYPHSPEMSIGRCTVIDATGYTQGLRYAAIKAATTV